MIKKCLFFSILVVSLSSCYTFTQYQTGRTVGKDKIESGVTINGLGAAGSGFGTIPPFKPEYQIAYGLTDKLDLIGKYSALAGLHAGVKYQFVGDRESLTALAAGFNLGGLFASGSTDGSSTINRLGFYQISVPLHFSYHPSEKFALGVSPNYSRIGFFNNNNEGGGNYFGIAPHIEVGRRVKFVIGTNILFGLSSGSSGALLEYGLGIKF